MRPNARTIRRLACIALGLAMTIAIALGSALAFPSRANLDAMQMEFLVEARRATPDPATRMERWLHRRALHPMLQGRTFGTQTPPGPAQAWAEARPGGTVIICSDAGMVDAIAPTPSTWFPNSRAVAYHTWMYRYHEVRGWPFPALAIPWRGAIDAPVIGSGEAFPRIRIPFRPFWSGAALDTVIFTTPLAWALVIYPALRRSSRRKRGRCEACAYDLASLPTCPECGAQARPV